MIELSNHQHKAKFSISKPLQVLINFHDRLMNRLRLSRGYMIAHRQLVNRLRGAKEKQIPITNYGKAIAFMHGLFDRAIELFAGRMNILNNFI